jgi:ligand-binding sensor protein
MLELFEAMDKLLQKIKMLESENSRLRHEIKKLLGEKDHGNHENKDYSFSDLFDIEEIQILQDAFAKATGVASIITNPDGTPITKPSNFCRLCIDVVRKTEKGLSNCYRSDSIIGAYNPDGPIVQTCLSCGLWDAGASIQADNKHLANWLIGQIRDEPADEKKMISYAQEIGVDVEEFLTAMKEVTIMPLNQFRDVAQVLFLFTNFLSKIAMQNMKQKESISKLANMLPICASCKKIRDDKGYWNQIEEYFRYHSNTVFTHGICPECAEKLYGEVSSYEKKE